MNSKPFDIFFVSESFKSLLCVNNVLDTLEFSNCKYNYVRRNCVCKESKSMYISVIFKFVYCLNATITWFSISFVQ